MLTSLRTPIHQIEFKNELTVATCDYITHTLYWYILAIVQLAIESNTQNPIALIVHNPHLNGW